MRTRRLGRPGLTLTLATAALVTGCATPAQQNTAPTSEAQSTAPAAEGQSTAAVPGVVAGAGLAYVDAVNARDLDALVRSFLPDGEILDVSRTIAGHDAIRSWAAAEVIGGSLRVLSVAEDRGDGQKLLVHWAPAGSAGWRAHYDLTYRDGRISRADLQYAD
ncbi:hypothetical protein Misp01_45860 [Microtetraspora sp. NBRC 13810]|uniref:nuclear transport factor 2 family protein n=1 Tax=Microtetraspora sp. NBRC 13810 TaxID=3030990 RepID=UPI0024A5017A|nr:nuclear transport factor 2 family protein [Microtetraspora sp. NBRC 13810]GLW09457.1 hypothetical protein Misp01_45860 [Microtetraspora sp. NBRC 13810]